MVTNDQERKVSTILTLSEDDDSHDTLDTSYGDDHNDMELLEKMWTDFLIEKQQLEKNILMLL